MPLARIVLLSLFMTALSLAQGFRDVTTTAGLAGFPASPVTFGTGFGVGDFDGDGDQDIAVPGAPGSAWSFYVNQGGLTFTEEAATRGFGISAVVKSLAVADVDNDGDLDLFAANWNATSELFINDGTGVFTEEAVQRGLTRISSAYSANFGDFDRDGLIDLHIGTRFDAMSRPVPNILYRNVGNGTFVDVSASSGADHVGPTFASAFMDYDQDGWPDIMIANDKGRNYVPNALLRNNGDGTFTDVSIETGTDVAVDGMGIDFADVFNDGGVDFYVSDLPPDHLFQLQDPVTRSYSQAQAAFGNGGGPGLVGWGCNWFDYDNDSWIDLHVVHDQAPNHVYRNPGTPAAALTAWTEQGNALGLDSSLGQYAAVFADFDNDGGVDVLYRHSTVRPTTSALRLYRNEVTRGNYLKIDPRGMVSNSSGIGAEVFVTANGVTQHRTVRSGVGFITSSDLRLNFGLGAAPTADVRIVWPSGMKQEFTAVAANQTLVAIEPSLDVVGATTPGSSPTLSFEVQGAATREYAMALAFGTMPGVVLRGGIVGPLAHDALLDISARPGNPLLPMCNGLVSGTELATSPLHIPADPSLTGLTVYAAALTVDASGIPFTVLPEAVSVTIQ